MQDRLQAAYLLLATAPVDENEDQRLHLRKGLDGATHSAIGVLGLPLGAYLDLASALRANRPRRSILVRELPDQRTAPGLDRSIAPFLLAHSNAMARAMENQFHWRRLAMPFHPAEPDVMAIIFLVEQAARQNMIETSIESLLDRVPLFEPSALLLRSVIEDRFNQNNLKRLE